MRVKQIISVLVLNVVLVFSISDISSFLQLKESDLRYASFFAEENQIDLLFLGSSHVRHGFFPMELWKDYGITSYNLAGNGNTIPVSYWTLVNALDYQTPRLIVMDVFDMWPGKKISPSWGHVHSSLDAIPISINKCKMVLDLFDDREMTDGEGNLIYDKRWEILFDLEAYHTRWNELEEIDFKSQSELEAESAIWKGSSPLIEIVPRKYPIDIIEDDLYYDECAKDYLERMIQLCNDKNIDVLLINTGYDCSGDAQYFADSIYELAGKYHVPYIDFAKLNIINFESDLQSSGHNTHVNFSGAEKFTTFIGKIISEKYQLSDYRNDVAYNEWWIDHQRFIESKIDYLRQQSSLELYLMFLVDDDYDVVMEIKDTSIMRENNYKAMFENIGIDISCLSTGSMLLAIDGAERNISYISNNYMSGSSWNSVLGNISLWSGEDETYGIYINGKELYVVNSEEEARVRIAVINRDTEEVIDIHTF